MTTTEIDAVFAGLACVAAALWGNWASGGSRRWAKRGSVMVVRCSRPVWPVAALFLLAAYCAVEAFFWPWMEATVAGWMR